MKLLKPLWLFILSGYETGKYNKFDTGGNLLLINQTV
jgi:hypothetical protein